MFPYGHAVKNFSQGAYLKAQAIFIYFTPVITAGGLPEVHAGVLSGTAAFAAAPA